MQERKCHKFCKGGINTSTGLRTHRLDPEVIGARAKNNTPLKKNTAKNKQSQSCPLGCIVMAENANKVNKLICDGYAVADICDQPARV